MTAPRPVRLSLTQMAEIVLPQHANALGTAFGGTVLSWIDICAAIAAQRHCGRIAVTAAIDEVNFLAPLRVGDVARLTGRVNAAFRTSVEVEVLVEREDRDTLAGTLCTAALLTFVNVDESGTPIEVPPLACESDEEKTRVDEAKERRRIRLAKKRS